MEVLTVKLRQENGCYACKFYEPIKNHPLKSGLCKKYYDEKDTWTEAIAQCKIDNKGAHNGC
jgi:hypothetical protein